MEMSGIMMNWSEICIHTTNEAIEPISNILHEFGAGGVVIEDSLDLVNEKRSIFGEIYALNEEDYPTSGVFVKGYLLADDKLAKTVEEIKRSINNLSDHQIDIGKNVVTLKEIQEEQWATAWKQYYKPVKVSDKITIVPTWESYSPVRNDEIIIELDPGMAFGTGTHPTTKLSIQALERFVKPGDNVIDVGCGSGVLSIAAAFLGAQRVTALDLDEVAVNSTLQNAELNQKAEQIFPKQNNLLDGIHVKTDIIVSNILAEIIIKFIADAAKNLKDGGLFITSGIIKEKKEDVMEQLEVHGFTIVEWNEMEEWISIVAKKNKK